MAVDWKKYTEITEVKTIKVYRAKDKKTKPQFAFRGQGDLEDEEGTAENFTDIKILAEEAYMSVFGLGVLSGYRYSSPPHEGKYRGIVMGKYLYRDNTITLPRFYARVIPRG
ncbi:MAG: hypothetical protein OXF48_03395, partial [Bacteroidetes bacterium]|nr:hypothetical protein [Bacteroidota bacterium]